MTSGIYDRPSVEDRFHSKYIKDESTGCWNWEAALSSFGYGLLNINRIITRAHRYSYELHTGVIPEGVLVLHECDNRKCVNPEHLFLGTQKDNMIDMCSKGRHA